MSTENINSSLTELLRNDSSSTLREDSYEIDVIEIPSLTLPKPTHKLGHNDFSSHYRIHLASYVHTNHPLTTKGKRRCGKIENTWNWLMDSRHPKRKFSLVVLIVLIITLSILSKFVCDNLFC